LAFGDLGFGPHGRQLSARAWHQQMFEMLAAIQADGVVVRCIGELMFLL
jgi:hypothetical protein